MSTMYVNKVQELNVGSGVHIPGHVIQVVEGTYDVQTDITSTSYADSGLSVTITPKSTSSKMYVVTNVHCYVNGTGLIGVKVVRNSNQVVEAQKALGFQDNASGIVTLVKLDSPPMSNTNPITYKVQLNIFAFTGTARMNQHTGGSRISVMEIAQ